MVDRFTRSVDRKLEDAVVPRIISKTVMDEAVVPMIMGGKTGLGKPVVPSKKKRNYEQ